MHLDVLALILAATEEADGRDVSPRRWSRTGVNAVLSVHVFNWCSMHRTLAPDGVPEALWTYLDFLVASGRIDPESDPLRELRKPLRCYGGLDEEGRPQRERGSAAPALRVPRRLPRSEGGAVTTSNYNVVMPVLSIRFKRDGAYERLRRYATEHAESASALGERLIDEGLRMAAHPGIVFRDGPAGRRAARGRTGRVRDRGAASRPARRRRDTSCHCGDTTRPDHRGRRAPRAATTPSSATRSTPRSRNEDAADRELAAWDAERRLLSG